MIDLGYSIIIGVFLVYYLLILFIEKKVLNEPREILEKFLSVILMYAGISLIYFSITGKPFFGDSIETYNIYIFLIGFIALIWTIPNLLSEFHFFAKFMKNNKKNNLKKKK
jgi:hypothetical protein